MDVKKFLNESQDPKAVQKILNRVSDLLTKGENIEYIAVQKKPAINLSSACLAITDKRIIFCRPGTLGFSMNFNDYLWKEVADSHMREGVLGATFTVKLVKGGVLSMDYLPKPQARILYRYAQEKEEEMSEYRRQRELEDSRARAGGGITLNTKTGENSSPQNNEDPVANLQKLKQLIASDLISQEEYDKKKEEILAKL